MDNCDLNLYAEPLPQISLKELVDSGKDLFTHCVEGKKPLLITNAYEVFPSLATWSPEFLRQKIGSKIIHVMTSKTGLFQEYYDETKMSFSDYVNEIEADNPNPARKLYMGSQPVAQFFPELLPDIHFDNLLPKDRPGLRDLWYGPGGNTTGLHFDPQYNFFIQLYGPKRFLLSEPSSFSKLSPRSAFSTYPRVTDFNPLKPDFDRFPKARQVKFYDVTMEPGSILYLAPYWWHQVMSYSTIISLNIWLETPKLMPERGSLQMFPTYIKAFLGKTLFAEKNPKKAAQT
jgi:hypothetical protein